MLSVEFRNLIVELSDKWHGKIPSSMVTLRSMGAANGFTNFVALPTHKNFWAMTQSAFAFQSDRKSRHFLYFETFFLYFYGFLS